MLARLGRGDGLEFVGEKDFDQEAETFFTYYVETTVKAVSFPKGPSTQ